MIETTMTRDEFVKGFCERSEMDEETLFTLHGMKAFPCDRERCDDPECPGWQMIRAQKWGQIFQAFFIQNVDPIVIRIVLEQMMIDMIAYCQPWGIDARSLEWEVNRPQQVMRGDNADYAVGILFWSSGTLPEDRCLKIGRLGWVGE